MDGLRPLSLSRASRPCPASDSLKFFSVYTNFWRTIISSLTYSGYIQERHSSFIYASTAFSEYRTHSDDLARGIATL